MAASVRLMLRRSIPFSSSHFKVIAAAGVSGRQGFDPGRFCCRCLNDAAADRNTHFGFQTVPEAEKAKKGESPTLTPPSSHVFHSRRYYDYPYQHVSPLSSLPLLVSILWTRLLTEQPLKLKEVELVANIQGPGKSRSEKSVSGGGFI